MDGPRGGFPKPSVQLGQDFKEPVLFCCHADFHSDAPAAGHWLSPSCVSVWMTDTDVDVGATTEPGCNIVDVVVHVLVNARLQAKRTDDAGVVVFFAGLDEFLAKLKGLLQQRFTNGRRVVPYHGHLRYLLVQGHGHLLWGR